MMALIPALHNALTAEHADNPAERPVAITAAATGREGLLQLQDELLGIVEVRDKKMAEYKHKAEETKQLQMLAEMLKREELKSRSKAFEEEQRKRRCMKEEELQRIVKVREEREREREERRATERHDQLERRQKSLVILQEMATKTKAERLTEQRERLLRYRERVTMDSRILSFLEHLQLTPSRIMHLLVTLRPHLPRMTYDDVLEFVVTGNRKVPSDMHAVDEQINNRLSGGDAHVGETENGAQENRFFIVDEGPSFWDSVMRIVAKQSDGQIRSNHIDAGKEEGERYLSRGTSGLFFHRRVNAVLDLFDYTMGTNETVSDPLPSLNVRSASRVLEKEALIGTEFCNGREALLACQERGLCVLHDNVCTLTALGFRYHYPFHDPEQMLGVQLARRRDKAREVMVEQRCANVEDEDHGEEEEEALVRDGTDDETMTSSAHDSTVCFTDELV
ncbi:hypothetical protein TraAM80_01993 [Trypanosoma rangeli]|uniref:Uncharacterized protein n=1 Tax=Trypanosoma rangeli TaxID=5698 RepID=A0A422NWC2_TRYRA|nr:uncharacterized protein TraAM80_01993 [Trypanosoma rangeli]RNF09725.1 hypothetical protein TraAM80_01993 [Trypanosoma rangeli]|eukprot:RNF09725.1 hypothetical protein TraAM80_01993 [Trypanosoma rangeli]